MTDNYVQTETARAPTVVQIHKKIRQRVELTDETTKAEVVVDVAKDVGVAQKRVGVDVDEPELLLDDDETPLQAFADGGGRR